MSDISDPCYNGIVVIGQQMCINSVALHQAFTRMLIETEQEHSLHILLDQTQNLYTMLIPSLIASWLTLSSASSLPILDLDLRVGAAQRAAYFLDNDPSGASVVSLNILSNGTLSNPVRTFSKGNGSYGKWVVTNPPPPDNSGYSGPDSLFSADAIVVSGNLLFVVNAGSNTLSLFKIDPTNPQHLTLVGEPASTLGDFPVSVAYSEKINTGMLT